MNALWRPLLLATMNAAGAQASAKLFARVLREMYGGAREAAVPFIPRAPLSDLFAAPVMDVLSVRRQTALAHARAMEIRPDAGGGWTVCFRHRAPVASRCVIGAVPPWSLAPLLARSGLRLPGFDAAAFEPSDIVSVHVWTRRPVTAHPMTALIGTRLQWYFPQNPASDSDAPPPNAPPRDAPACGSCTISAAREVSATRADAERAVVEELPRLFPGLRPDDIVRTLAVHERRATFIAKPGMETKRPGVRTELPGLFLAGDWTGTGLPATIESAARSAEAASAAALEFLRTAG
jgi:hypothetical protein